MPPPTFGDAFPSLGATPTGAFPSLGAVPAKADVEKQSQYRNMDEALKGVCTRHQVKLDVEILSFLASQGPSEVGTRKHTIR